MSPRLQVHPLAPADLDFVRQLAQNERVTRFVGDGQPWSDAYLQGRFDEALGRQPPTGDREISWYIARDAAGEPVGLLALVSGPTDTVIGYWIRPDAWGRGHAGELVAHARRLAGALRPLTAVVHRDNAGSRRVLERAGFEPSAQDGPPSDELTYRWAGP